MKNITISAFCEDYSLKAYKLYFGNSFEFLPKSRVQFLENSNGDCNFGTGIESRYFKVPMWLFNRLHGVNFYGC